MNGDDGSLVAPEELEFPEKMLTAAEYLREKYNINRGAEDDLPRFPQGEGQARVGFGHHPGDILCIRQAFLLIRGELTNAYEKRDFQPGRSMIQGLIRQGPIQGRISLVDDCEYMRPSLVFDVPEDVNLGALTDKIRIWMQTGTSLCGEVVMQKNGICNVPHLFNKAWVYSGRPPVRVYPFEYVDIEGSEETTVDAAKRGRMVAEIFGRKAGQVDGQRVAYKVQEECPECNKPMTLFEGKKACSELVAKIQILEEIQKRG